jgi:hypothetical protein
MTPVATAPERMTEQDAPVPLVRGEQEIHENTDVLIHELGQTIDEGSEQLPRQIPPERARQIAHGPITYFTGDETKDAEVAATDQADRRLTERLNGEAGFLRRTVRNAWVGDWFKSHYRGRYKRQALKEIKATQNVLHYEADSAESRNSQGATVDRFITMNEGMIDESESRKEHTQDSEFVTGIKGILTRYRNGEITRAGLKQAEKEFLDEYTKRHGADELGEGDVRVGNIEKIADAVMGRIEQGESLEYVFENMRFVTGKVRSGLRSEANYTKVEQLTEKVLDSRIGSLVSPELISIGVSVATIVSKMSMRSAIGLAGLVGVSGAVFGYMRESKRTTDERTQHLRERAMGKEYDEGSKRREEMETTRYDSRTSVDLTNAIAAAFNPDRLASGGRQALENAISTLAAVEARVQFGVRNNIETIDYTHNKVAQERLALNVARAKAKIALRKTFANGGDQLIGRPGIDADTFVETCVRAHTERHEADYTKKNEAFNKIRKRRSRNRALIGGLTSLAGSFIGSAIETGVDNVVSDAATELHGQYEASHFGDHGTIEVSKDYQIIQHVNAQNGGTIEIADKDGNLIPGLSGDHSLHVDKEGHLDDNALTALKNKQFNVEDLTKPGIEATPPLAINDYIAQHPGEFQHLRVSYENNFTKAFDLNEQGGRLSYNPDGTINIQQSMTAGGSFNSEGSIDMTQQPNAFDISFRQPDGTFAHKIFQYGQPIPKPWADTLYQKPDGNWGFHGNGEVHWGKVDGDTFYSAASLPGDGQEVLVPGNPPVNFEHFKLTGPEQSTGVDYFVAPTLGSRKGLENVKAPTPDRPPRRPDYYIRGYHNRYMDDHEREILRSEIMPELLENPDATIAPKAALDFYADLLGKKRGSEYVQSIYDTVANTPELRDMPEKTQNIIGIPVNAAGSSEANGIYDLLSRAYAQQDPATLEKSMILLHVNWYDDAMNDEEMRANIEKTRAEIARARADLPGLHIASFETEWKRAEMGDTPIIGYVAKKLEDVTLIALKQAMESGKIPEDRDALLIRNDADAIGIHRNYLKNFSDAADDNPDIDIFTGTTTFDNTKVDRLPEMVFSSNFAQNLDLLIASREKHAHTGGANWGVKSAIKAATGGMGFELGSDSGVGSDDVNIAHRIRFAREGALGRTRQNGLRAYVARQRYSRMNGGATTKRQIAKRVVGARIDTDSDRSESLFLQGVAVINSWSGDFDARGYRYRTDENVETLRREYEAKIAANPEARIDQVINDMETSIEVFKDFPAAIRTAAELAFSGITDPTQRRAAYDFTRDADGNLQLVVSASGRRHIANFLDAYSHRKMRQMYGVGPDGSQVKPKPMMLAV